MIKLYYAPGTCALAAHTVLEEVGADYELQKVDLKAGEHKQPAYLAINPKGSVPALGVDEGILTENPAILTWLADDFAEADLGPGDDPFLRARFLSYLAFLASSVHPQIGRLLFNKEPSFDDEARAHQRNVVLSKLRVLEDHLFHGPWALGGRFTVADPYQAVFERWARQAGLLDKHDFPKLNAHLDVVQDRPAAVAALKAEGLAPV